MPTYIYTTIPKGKKQPVEFEVVQSMKDAPLTKHPETGEPVRRIVTGGLGFNMHGDKVDPFSEKQFRERTAQKGDTLGALWDRSRDLSETRAAKNGGVDPVKQRFFKDYSRRKKVPHTAELAEGQKAAKDHLEKGLKKLGLGTSDVVKNLGKVS